MAHKLRLLAQLGQCRVEGCSCGVVHLHVGAVSLRLEAEQALELTQALRSASREFEVEQSTISAAELKATLSDDDEPPEGQSQLH